MRPRVAAWLLGLAGLSAGVSATYVTCPGCIDRTRINSACEWSGDTAFPIDNGNPTHRAHLAGDAHIAEELAIRYADAEHGRRFGVEHHGGLLDGGRLRRECLARMLHAIETNHGVTSEQVQLARGRRNWTFDVAVGLLFLPLYLLAAIAAIRRLARRFPPDERLPRLVATGVASLAVSFLGLQALRFWGAVWEVVRVGNGHMTSIRVASKTSWMHHVDGQLLGAILLFWLVAVCCSRVSQEEPAGAARPGGAFL